MRFFPTPLATVEGPGIDSVQTAELGVWTGQALQTASGGVSASRLGNLIPGQVCRGRHTEAPYLADNFPTPRDRELSLWRCQCLGCGREGGSPCTGAREVTRRRRQGGGWLIGDGGRGDAAHGARAHACERIQSNGEYFGCAGQLRPRYSGGHCVPRQTAGLRSSLAPPAVGFSTDGKALSRRHRGHRQPRNPQQRHPKAIFLPPWLARVSSCLRWCRHPTSTAA